MILQKPGVSADVFSARSPLLRIFTAWCFKTVYLYCKWTTYIYEYTQIVLNK
jgi:hypothetical protein